jgi:hypothetical protein
MFFMNKLGLNRENEADRQELLIVDNDDPAKGTEKLSQTGFLPFLQIQFCTESLGAPGIRVSIQKLSQSQEFQGFCDEQTPSAGQG